MTPELIAGKRDDRLHFARCAGRWSLASFLARRTRPFAALLFALLLSASHADLAVAAELGRIGVTVTDLGNPFFVRVARGVEVAARRLLGPTATVYVVSSAYDLNRQEQQINAFIKRKVDLIVLVAADPVALEPAVRRAQAAGVRVAAIDVRAEGADVTVTTDNFQAGELACQQIIDRLGGKGNVIVISGPPVSATTDRVAGCVSRLAPSSGIHVLSSDRNGGGSSEGGFVKMTDLLTAFPHIDAVFAINDPTALGVDEAARQAGRKEFFVIGVDGSPMLRTRMYEADSLIIGTVAQKPDLLAEKVVELGYALIRHKPVADRVIKIPAVLVTRGSAPVAGSWEQ